MSKKRQKDDEEIRVPSNELPELRIQLAKLREDIEDSIVAASRGGFEDDPMGFYMLHSWSRFKDAFDDVIIYVDEMIKVDKMMNKDKDDDDFDDSLYE